MEMKEEQILEFLEEVDVDFPVHLSEKVVLSDYAQKLYTHATLCTEYCKNKIIGMVAGYTENLSNGIAYIALVGVRKEVRHQGIAQKLIVQFLQVCKEKKIRGVHVYTDVRNKNAIKMYEKIGFKCYKIENEPRPKDVHLILYLD